MMLVNLIDVIRIVLKIFMIITINILIASQSLPFILKKAYVSMKRNMPFNFRTESINMHPFLFKIIFTLLVG